RGVRRWRRAAKGLAPGVLGWCRVGGREREVCVHEPDKRVQPGRLCSSDHALHARRLRRVVGRRDVRRCSAPGVGGLLDAPAPAAPAFDQGSGGRELCRGRCLADNRRYDAIGSSPMGRTIERPSPAISTKRLLQSTSSFCDLKRITAKPPMTSFASVYGPSLTTVLPFLRVITVAGASGFQPPVSSSTPACTA